MKAKFSLKKVNFKELFLQHVEKAVLAVTGVCLLLFIVSALRRETLPEEKQPDRLTLQTQNAKAHVEKGTFKQEEVQPDGPPLYAGRVRRDPVKLATYDITVPINGPIISSRVLRGEPTYLSVTDLRVGSGFSPFATRDPNAVVAGGILPRRPRPNQEAAPEEEIIAMGDRRRGGVKMAKDDIPVIRYWTVVTGLIPVRAQKKAHFETFEEAVGFDPEQDLPRYLGFLMERAEVTSGDLKNLKWVPLKADAKFIDSWTTFAEETVVPEYVTTVFSAPLGPRVWADWGDESGHAPEIPFEPKRGAAGLLPPGMRGGPMGPAGGNFQGDFEGGGAMGPGGFAGEEEEEGNEFDRGVTKKRPVMTEDPAEARRRSEQVATIGDKAIKGVDHLLFRFCDYTVRPGKQYVYRVRLGFGNPNFGVPVKNLQKPELADGRTRMSDWSEASPVATIPYGDKMLAGKVVPAQSSVAEPRGQVRIVQVKEDLGAEAPLEQEIARGTLLNFVDQPFMYPDPREQRFKEGTGDFVTNAIVLDLRGGKPVFGPRDKDFTEPGEILVMSRTGELLAMNEFDDEDVWKDYIPPEDPRQAGEALYNPEAMMEGVPPRNPRQPGGARAPKAGRTQPGQQFDPLNGPVSPQTGPRQRPPRRPN